MSGRCMLHLGHRRRDQREKMREAKEAAAESEAL